MRVIHAYNFRKVAGGEDRMVELIDRVLSEHSVEVEPLRRDIAELGPGFAGKLKAFLFGIHPFSSRRAMSRLITEREPDLVHVHNLYPQLTLGVLSACRDAELPIVKHCHDYSLTCPVTTHWRAGHECMTCGTGHDYWCALRNCRGRRLESVAYSIRHTVARGFWPFQEYVTTFIAVSAHLKQHLVSYGFSEEQIDVIPNPVEIPASPVDAAEGQYVSFVGRLVSLKGVEVLSAAARQLPHIPFRFAGEGPLADVLKRDGPPNAEFLGPLKRAELARLYRRSRLVVVPSLWAEPFGLTANEAMSHALPVIAARIGGLAEVVQDGVTGLLVEPGHVGELVRAVGTLWQNPDLCRRMGQAGRKRAQSEYGEPLFFERLSATYQRAVAKRGRRRASGASSRPGDTP